MKKKKLNQKDIDRFNRNLADFLGVRRYGGYDVGEEEESDKKTELFVQIMESLEGEFLFIASCCNSHELNVKRHLMSKSVFVRNPAYCRQIDTTILRYKECRNDFVYIVPEENVETALLFGFPKYSQ